MSGEKLAAEHNQPVYFLPNSIAHSKSVLYSLPVEKHTRWQLGNSGTDLRMRQIGHGLGPRAFGGPCNDLSYNDSMLTKNMQNCAEA